MLGTRRCAIWCGRGSMRYTACAGRGRRSPDFCCGQGCHYGRPAWTKLHRRWLAGLKFDQAVHHVVLEDYIAAVEVAQIRRDRLTAPNETTLPDSTAGTV